MMGEILCGQVEREIKDDSEIESLINCVDEESVCGRKQVRRRGFWGERCYDTCGVNNAVRMY